MDRFIAYQLEFHCRAVSAVVLPRNNGSMLRGALLAALRHSFCLNKKLSSCLACDVAEACPICRLATTVDRDSNRGVEVPRPFVLKPILGGPRIYQPDEEFAFGVTLFGGAQAMFPYVMLAIRDMGDFGIGDRRESPGRFTVARACAVNPFTGASETLYRDDEGTVRVPQLAVMDDHVTVYAARLPRHTVQLELLTPLRLVADGALVHRLSFRVLVQRLLRRLTDLYTYHCGATLELDFPAFIKSAEQVTVAADGTRWLDLSSYSSRRHTTTPVGGLIGHICFSGDVAPFLRYLLWGQVTHVGKDATRGNGWYRIGSSL